MTWKPVVAYLAWLLAAGALALLFSLLIGELVALIGIVDSGSDGQQTVVEVATIAWFILLGALPFLLLRHILKSEE